MNTLARYTASDIPALLDKISKNSIGMNEYLNRVFDLHETTTNYPPYNLVQVSNVESRLEIALAGLRRKKSMYTHKMVNSLLRVRKRTKKRKQHTFTRVWLNGRLLERGRSLTIQKFDQLILKMGF